MNRQRRHNLVPIRQNSRERVSPYPIETYGTAVDGTPLSWYIVEPDYDVFTPPRPVGLFGHVGGYKNGSALEGNLLEMAAVCASYGIIGLSVQYRMDKLKVPGQPLPVYWPCESDDFKQAVVAARAGATALTTGVVDPLNIFGVGGSTGADLVLRACCDTTGNPGGFNNWTAADRLKFGVLLSGPLKYEDRTVDPWLKPFVANVNLYCQSKDLGVQAAKSPLAFMGADCPPLYVGQFESDTMPRAQYDAVVAKIAELGIANCHNQLWTGSGHAFDGYLQFVAAGGMDWITERLAA